MTEWIKGMDMESYHWYEVTVLNLTHAPNSMSITCTGTVIGMAVWYQIFFLIFTSLSGAFINLNNVRHKDISSNTELNLYIS